ncbi:MAG: phosphoribosylaminoimidazolesuccinocarboxamide synthase [Acidobacteria bacterium]|nr:MAG: phosphoribosylaminoimidazolesuccinocarboxamide synthase [Acidobacteriota bacterium]
MSTKDDAVYRTELPGLPPPRRGKVRDVYDLGSELLIVACDRISAYDHVLKPAVPGKGKILCQLTVFWLERLASLVPHHLLASDARDFPARLRPHAARLAGRAMLVKKAEVVPFECVARGYLAGSGFRDYRRTGTVCGHRLPPGLERASRLPAPIFTPATKAEEGHDENVDYATLERAVGAPLAARLEELTLALYRHGADHAAGCGLILADTKFEFGHAGGELILIDEVLTPDSSRYWEAADWRPGVEPTSFDKQYVRNWLDQVGWDHASPPPELPPEVVAGTRHRYLEAFRRLTGREPQL